MTLTYDCPLHYTGGDSRVETSMSFCRTIKTSQFNSSSSFSVNQAKQFFWSKKILMAQENQ